MEELDKNDDDLDTHNLDSDEDTDDDLGEGDVIITGVVPRDENMDRPPNAFFGESFHGNHADEEADHAEDEYAEPEVEGSDEPEDRDSAAEPAAKKQCTRLHIQRVPTAKHVFLKRIRNGPKTREGDSARTQPDTVLSMRKTNL